MDTMIKESSEFVIHLPCENPDCGSSDANSLYSDGHTHCFACNTTVQNSTSEGVSVAAPPSAKAKLGLLAGDYKDIVKRGLTKDLCRKYDYFTTTYKGERVHVANYRDKNGEVVAQKIRNKHKQFSILGDAKKITLFGSHLKNTGKLLVICEGEVDTLSASACLGKYHAAVVGIPHGAASAAKAIKDNYDYIAQFDKCVLCLDNDDAGRAASLEAAQVLPIGKAYIATVPMKDVNECLVAGKSAAVVSAIFEARVYRPDSIMTSADFRSVISQDDAASSITYPYSALNAIVGGVRLRDNAELVTICAGSGLGKTTLLREITYHLHQQGEKLGLINLEESNKRSLLGLIGIHLNKNITVNKGQASKEEIEAAYDELFPDDHQIYLYDHFGSCDIDTIIRRIGFMVKALGVTVIILDHISILVSGLATNDERKLIDIAMTRLRTEVVQELGVTVMAVSHLRRPSGDKGFEGGETPTLQSLRGSASIAQLSDICISLAVEKDDPHSDTRILAILKNRWSGQTGRVSGTLKFNRDTGRLVEEGSEF